jgi:hypothetical protein
MIARALVAFAMSVLVAEVHASDLAIGSVALALRMDRATVMEKLRARFHIVAVTGDDNSFFVSEKKPPNVQVVGGVKFENDRLSWVQRNWGSFSGQANPVEIGKALFGVMETVTARTDSNVQVGTRSQRIPGAEFDTIEFSFPDRKVTVSVTDGGSRYGRQVSIDESISSRR